MATTQLLEQQPDTEINIVASVVSEDSKITNVSLYSGRAEITRVFTFQIKAGQNKVTILGLPPTLHENSLRVEGHGNAAIHDAIISKSPRPQSPVFFSKSHAGDPLKRKREEIKKALTSAHQSRMTVDSYMSTITAKEFDMSHLETALEGYKELTRKVDHQILDLEKELAQLEQQISTEKNSKTFVPYWQAVINIHGQVDEEVKTYLKYVVYSADWTATYDVRVDTQTKEEKAVTIIYKAVITQNTGESWDNVPLTLETATPSFGISPPVLSPWRVKSFRGRESHRSMPTAYSHMPMSVAMSMPPATIIQQPPAQGPIIIQQPSSSSSRSSSGSPSRMQRSRPSWTTPVVSVSNKGNIAATFRVPGLINVPSDVDKHNVTIAQLNLGATLLWYTIPASDTHVHMKAKIKNESDYTFIPSSANIYVDGSFIATTNIPSVSPQEVFDCPLGLDPSIRVTYHPPEKKSAVSGFYQKTKTEAFTQRITVLNSKSTVVKNLKVVDHVPVSEDEQIEVKLVSPPLTMPPKGALSAGVTSSRNKVAAKVEVSQNVTAQWDGSDEAGFDQAAIGKDGKFNWFVTIPPQKSVSLVIQCEVNYPEGYAVQGL